MLQAFFDDSGSDPKSRAYVLAGYVGSLETWTAFSESWDYHLKKKPQLEYFKMSEAMGFHDQFKGWSVDARDGRVVDLSEVIGSSEIVRIECFLRRSDFDDFVKGTITGRSWDDPYFICFYHLCMTLAASDGLNWSPHFDIIFDEHGKVGKHAAIWWDKIKELMPVEWAAKLGSAPLFRNDICFKPLQGADMYAWLVRYSLLRDGRVDGLPLIAFNNILRRRGIQKHMTKDELMQLGAGLLVARSNVIRRFGVADPASSKRSLKKNPRRRPDQD
jgi:hypothetical protein